MANLKEFKPKAKMGRKPIAIDEEEVRKLAHIHCTMEEIGFIVGCSVQTLEDRFRDVIKAAKANGKMSLRRAQFKLALEGNATMCIWLGKILLSQKDAVEHTIKPEFNNETKDKLFNMYQRIESLAAERKKKYIAQEPTQGLLVEACQIPPTQN